MPGSEHQVIPGTIRQAVILDGNPLITRLFIVLQTCAVVHMLHRYLSC
jgi:hypothetical protein